MVDKILTLSCVAGILTVARHFPAAWEVNPMSTAIVSGCVIFSCIRLLSNAFEKAE